MELGLCFPNGVPKLCLVKTTLIGDFEANVFRKDPIKLPILTPRNHSSKNTKKVHRDTIKGKLLFPISHSLHLSYKKQNDKVKKKKKNKTHFSKNNARLEHLNRQGCFPAQQPCNGRSQLTAALEAQRQWEERAFTDSSDRTVRLTGKG